MTPRLDLRQAQSLTMTPRLQQAIRLLQMTSQELETFVAEELERNPFIEAEGSSRDEEADSFEKTEFEGRSELEALCDKITEDEAPPDMPDFTDEDSFYEHEDSSFENTAGGMSDPWRGQGGMDEDFNPVDLCAANQQSLQSVLINQINAVFYDEKERSAAFFILENMDENGFVHENLSDDFSRKDVFEKVLSKMKTFEPTGVFSSSLEEFFAAQLKEKNRYDPAMAELLKHLDLVAAKEYAKLTKLCGVDMQDLSDMLDELRRLNPRCTTEFDDNSTVYIVPDVLVRQNKSGNFVVELNQAALPRVLMNRRYIAEISVLSKTSKEAKKFLSEQLSSANFLIKALQQRAESILKTAAFIVERQQDFFKYGAQALKPMILKDAAEAVGLHESTVSRVCTNKYLVCSYGTFELRYFFSKALESADGENVSATCVKNSIKELIAAETPENVLSDEDLVVLLGRKGVKIARRTVAKYRESMNIPTSAQRKREKRLKKAVF